MKLLQLTTLLALLLVACGGPTAPAAPTAAATAVTDAGALPPATTVAPAANATSTPRILIQPSATPVPTATPTTPPTATPTPTPEPTVPAEVVIEADGITLPPGFSIIRYADLGRPTALTFDAQGRLWAANFIGEIWVLQDDDGDGRAETRTQFAFGFDQPVGVAIDPDNGDVYVSQSGKITIARDTTGDLVADEYESIVSGLPYSLHKNNNLEFGPDGWLYMGVGSTCNVCVESDARSATIMRFDPVTGAGEVVASGLRNAFDLAFHPQTGELFATENGRDDLGEFEPLEELNHIRFGQNYGWPECWDRFSGSGCAGTTMAIGFFQARSSVNGLTFYRGDRFPAAYRDNVLFATVFGSWFYPQGIEHGIHQIRLIADGDSYRSEISWFARWENTWLLPIIDGPDGALYVSNYDINNVQAGTIWRISYGVP